jgi:chemotaxis family two-component system sensor kinase Cph1
VDELLNLARTGRQALHPQLTGLNSVVEEVVSMLKAEINGREVEWKIGSLPSVKCDPISITARADRHKALGFGAN